MNIVLFEDAGYRELLPLTWLQPAFEIRCGRDRLIDKVRAHAGQHLVRVLVRPELERVVRERTPLHEPVGSYNWCFLNARCMPRADLLLPPVGCAWVRDGSLLAATLEPAAAAAMRADLFLDPARLAEWTRSLRTEPAPAEVELIRHPWQPALCNAEELQRQCRTVGGQIEGRVYSGAHLLNTDMIRIAPGAVVMPGVVLDAEPGPIEIDGDALIQPNAVVEGPCYIGPRSIIRPGATLRGGVTIGPVCKVGGEIEASVFQGYANKQHDGFLGHSFVGSWVNLGASTVTSDLKNTYGTIRVSVNGIGVETGQHFIGAMIGDHTKTGIGTILPTGCILGVASNVFTRQPVPKFVPSFAWLTDEGLTRYRIEKAVVIARQVMGRREIELTEAEAELLARTAELAGEVEAAGWAS